MPRPPVPYPRHESEGHRTGQLFCGKGTASALTSLPIDENNNISPSSPAYTEATRLLKFLDYIVALAPEEMSAIPPTSILREFIDGQTL